MPAQFSYEDTGWRRELWAEAALLALELGRAHGDVDDALELFEAREPELAIDLLGSMLQEQRLWATPFEEALSNLRSLVSKWHYGA